MGQAVPYETVLRDGVKKRNTAVVNKHFKKLKSQMQQQLEAGKIGSTLGHSHHRMLLEDVMGISVGEKIIFLIHQSHNFVSGNKETWWSRRIHTIASDYVTSHCCYVKFQDNP